MGCSSNRKKQTREFADQKWDYINLEDFKAKGCGPGFAYAYLWFMLIISIAVYAVDTFTAVNLLAFNRWSSKIKPAIPFDISKWIFSMCILLSFLNLAYEAFRAIRVMRRGNVAECFLDNLAVRWESIRLGSGQGWKRFLVFAELTRSKRGSEYVALFTYFSFQSWIRVIFCSGPRQVVNALTLRSVYQDKLVPTSTSVDGAILGFFGKIKKLASEDYQQAVVLSGMCFTFVVWVFSALFLLMAVLFYVFFLFHWIPQADGGLTAYCERKVTKKLLRIVTTKVNKALEKGQVDRLKAELKLARRSGEKMPHIERAATLPTLPNVQVGEMGHSSPGCFELGSLGGRRLTQQTGMTDSTPSFSSRAPLIPCAADMGFGQRSQSSAPSLPDVALDRDIMRPVRHGTSASQSSVSNAQPEFVHGRNASMGASLRTITASPAAIDYNMTPCSGRARPGTNRSVGSNATASVMMGRVNTGPVAYQSYPSCYAGREANSAPSAATSRFHGGVSLPARSMTGPVSSMPPLRGVSPMQRPPQRNMTAPPAAIDGRDWSKLAQSLLQQSTPIHRGGPYGYDAASHQRSDRYY